MPQSRGWEKKIAEGPPCVVLASPGFMQTGSSRELFELWAPDWRNGLIITGYSIEGTPARVSGPAFMGGGYLLCITISVVYTVNEWTVFPHTTIPRIAERFLSTCDRGTHARLCSSQDILTEQEEFTTLKGHTIPRKISVDYISFSAHVDFSQNSEFIELIKAQHVVRSFLQQLHILLMMPFARSWFMVNKTTWVVSAQQCQLGTNIATKTSKYTPLAISRHWNSPSVARG